MIRIIEKEGRRPAETFLSAGNTVPAEERTRQINAELTRLAYAQLPVALMVTLINATLLVFVLRQVIDIFSLFLWWVYIVSLTCTRFMLLHRYQRAEPAVQTDRQWRTFFTIGALSAGCGWGAAGLFFFLSESMSHEIFLAFLLGGMSIGAVASMAAIKRAYFGFVLLTIAPLSIRLFFQGEELFIVMGVLLLIFVAGLLVLASQFHHATRESLALRFERQDLLQSQEVLQQSNDELDRRVQARTAELMAVNASLHAEVRERERAEDELRVSEARSHAMLQAIPDMMFRLSRDGVVLDYKAEDLSCLSIQPESLSGKRITDVLPADTAQRGIEAIAEALRSSEAQVFEYVLPLDKAREFEARIAVSGPDTVVAIVRDITERKEVERLKDTFISTVSHELRTPLTSVHGFTELMLTRDFPPEQQRKMLTIIQKESTRLTGLLNDFLDLQRIESGQQHYDMTSVDLGPVLHNSVMLFTPNAPTHTFRTIVPESLPMVAVDIDRIRQVLINFLSNAVKFSPQGGEITVGTRYDNGEVVVWIADQGIGIASEDLGKIFERFFRVDNQDTQKIGGTGLGLTLVKEIIAVHRGRVWVDSTPGQGSTFFFSLPVRDHTLDVIKNPL